jgi:hypothetical protein
MKKSIYLENFLKSDLLESKHHVEKPVAIVLEHLYPHNIINETLLENSLTGNDNYRFRQLQQLNNKNDMSIFVVRAVLEIQELGDKSDFNYKLKMLNKFKKNISEEEEESIVDDSSNSLGICTRKSKTACGWYNEKGEQLFEEKERVGDNDKVSLDFFIRIKLENNNFWTFKNAVCEIAPGYDGYLFTVKYECYMLFLWPNKHLTELKETITGLETDFFNLIR